MAPHLGETWVYESLVSAIPGVELSDRTALLIQFVVFEAIVLATAAVYDLWAAVPAGTAAIVVAVAGSWLMLTFSRTVRQLQPPTAYRRLLFGSSIELALSVMAFVLFVTYLFVVDPRDGGSLLTDLLGAEPPVIAVVLLLLVTWDVIYRIGACWWATSTGWPSTNGTIATWTPAKATLSASRRGSFPGGSRAEPKPSARQKPTTAPPQQGPKR